LGFLSWLSDLFEGSEEYGTPSVTLTGQPVRSKGEKRKPSVGTIAV